MSRRNKNNDILTVDAFSNPMFRLGFGTQAPLEATEYPLTRLTDNYAKLNSMYRSVGILQSIIDVVPQDMLREWFTLSGDIDPDKQAEFDKAVQKIKLKSKIDEGLRWGRLYGGAAGFIMIKGQEDSLDKPLDLEAILPDTPLIPSQISCFRFHPAQYGACPEYRRPGLREARFQVRRQ